MTLRNTILVGSLVVTAACAADEVPEDDGVEESTPLVTIPEDDQIQEPDCEAITIEAERKIKFILEQYICNTTVMGDSTIVYYPHQKDAGWERPENFSDLSSVQGTTGDCGEAVKQFGNRIDEARPGCTNSAEIVNRPLFTGLGNIR